MASLCFNPELPMTEARIGAVVHCQANRATAEYGFGRGHVLKTELLDKNAGKIPDRYFVSCRLSLLGSDSIERR
jgi:hypothetical protein